MTTLITLTIAYGALSYNPTLEMVGITRQTQPTLHPITQSIDHYQCRIGVPYGYGYLIGRETYFLADSGVLYGPFIVTDVESVKHLEMAKNGLLADIDCNQYVHLKGYLMLKGRH